MHKMHKEKVVLYCTRKKVKLLLCCEPPHSTSPSSTHFQITLGLAAWLFATEKSQLTNCPTAMPGGAPPPHINRQKQRRRPDLKENWLNGMYSMTMGVLKH